MGKRWRGEPQEKGPEVAFLYQHHALSFPVLGSLLPNYCFQAVTSNLVQVKEWRYSFWFDHVSASEWYGPLKCWGHQPRYMMTTWKEQRPRAIRFGDSNQFTSQFFLMFSKRPCSQKYRKVNVHLYFTKFSSWGEVVRERLKRLHSRVSNTTQTRKTLLRSAPLSFNWANKHHTKFFIQILIQKTEPLHL